MWTRRRGALGGAVAAWVLVVGCGDRATRPAPIDAALQRDLRLATAASVSLAVEAPTARFLPAADEVRRATPVRRAPRPVHRTVARTPVATPTPVPETPVAVASAVASEPATERMQRYAGEEGASSMPVGVVLRGGAVGDDHCDRELPRARPAPATLGYRATTVRLGGVPTGPRTPAGIPFAPPI